MAQELQKWSKSNLRGGGSMNRFFAVVGVLAVILMCGALIAGTVFIIEDVDISVDADTDYIPPIVLRWIGADGEKADRVPDEPADSGIEVSGVGTITIGRKTMEITRMTQPYLARDFPDLFSPKGQEVTISGRIVGIADDRIEVYRGGKWEPVTRSVSEYGVLPTGKHLFRVINTGGSAWIRFLEQLP